MPDIFINSGLCKYSLHRVPCIEVEAYKETKTSKPLLIGTGNALFVDDEKVLVDIGEPRTRRSNIDSHVRLLPSRNGQATAVL